MGNEWTDLVQQLVDFAHAFPRFSVMNNKSRPCIPEFLPNIFRVLEGLAAYPTVMLYLGESGKMKKIVLQLDSNPQLPASKPHTLTLVQLASIFKLCLGRIKNCMSFK